MNNLENNLEENILTEEDNSSKIIPENASNDEIALYFLNFPNRFDVFRSNNKYDDIISNKNIENIEFRCYVHMFWKLIDYLKFSPLDLRLTLNIGIHLWNLRQDVMKNLSLGDWAVGRTSAIYVYNQDQYDKERKDMEDSAIRELQIGAVMDDVSDMHRDIYMMDHIAEQHSARLIEREENTINMAEDDDFGEHFDGDEYY